MAAKKTSSTTGPATRGRPTIPASHSSARSGATAKKAAGTARKTVARGSAAVRPGLAPKPAAKSASKTARPGATKRVAGLIAAAKERGAASAATEGKAIKPAKTKAAPASSLASDRSRELATMVAVAALDKKAVGLEIIDVAGRVDYADFIVVMTGRSDRQVNALAQGIEDELKKKGQRPMAIEGLPHANWVIMDYGDVVVHVFQDDARRLYDIESLWLDAKRVPIPESVDTR